MRKTLNETQQQKADSFISTPHVTQAFSPLTWAWVGAVCERFSALHGGCTQAAGVGSYRASVCVCVHCMGERTSIIDNP